MNVESSDAYLSLENRTNQLLVAAKIINSDSFKEFIRAENRLVAEMSNMCDPEDPSMLHELESSVATCVNRFLTFKCTPWQSSSK